MVCFVAKQVLIISIEQKQIREKFVEKPSLLSAELTRVKWPENLNRWKRHTWLSVMQEPKSFVMFLSCSWDYMTTRFCNKYHFECHKVLDCTVVHLDLNFFYEESCLFKTYSLFGSLPTLDTPQRSYSVWAVYAQLGDLCITYNRPLCVWKRYIQRA